MSPDEKICETCGAIYRRRPHVGPRQFARRRFCSPKCTRPCGRDRYGEYGDGWTGVAHNVRERVLSRLLATVRVDETSGCWIATGRANREGYVWVWHPELAAYVPAHRFTCALTWGPLPPGTVPDHLCRTPRCINGYHLEIVPHVENIRRAGPRKRSAVCHRGHPRRPGKPHCRACARLSQRRRYAEKRQKNPGPGQIRGEQIYTAKLTADDVRAIRAAYQPGKVSQQALAERFGVLQSQISQIVRRVGWRHVE